VKKVVEISKKAKKGKNQIVKTATDLFARKGYHETTVDEIAQALGIAKGTIYNHFQNKEDLYQVSIQEGINLFKKELHLAVEEASSTRDKISNIIKRQLIFYEREKALVLLFLTEFCSPDQQKGSFFATKLLSSCLEIISDVIADGIKDGTFRKVDIQIATSSLFGMVTLNALHYITQFQKIPVEDVCKGIEEIFFKGIAS